MLRPSQVITLICFPTISLSAVAIAPPTPKLSRDDRNRVRRGNATCSARRAPRLRRADARKVSPRGRRRGVVSLLLIRLVLCARHRPHLGSGATGALSPQSCHWAKGSNAPAPLALGAGRRCACERLCAAAASARNVQPNETTTLPGARSDPKEGRGVKGGRARHLSQGPAHSSLLQFLRRHRMGLELWRKTPASGKLRSLASPMNSSQVVFGFLPPPNEILAAGAAADLR